ncbi:hypothetical protein H109_08050 [Trichophyton interdigitale MR816]|uniref:Uncharacterized protein n=1 Tax=Trichophyton interdigitale (strain MR816) TaxID=1215338 RepID=A0A059IX13_TRIIM|nr:hypothetical protein H109_08050 [Trichophyton interdigitale MR816]
MRCRQIGGRGRESAEKEDSKMGSRVKDKEERRRPGHRPEQQAIHPYIFWAVVIDRIMAATTTTPTRPRHRQHKLHNYTSQNVPIQAGPSEMDHGSCMVDGGQGKQAPSSCLANRSSGRRPPLSSLRG